MRVFIAYHSPNELITEVNKSEKQINKQPRHSLMVADLTAVI
jgi:hypothetical protein